MEKLYIPALSNPPSEQDLQIVEPIFSKFRTEFQTGDLELQTKGNNIILALSDSDLKEAVAGELTGMKIPYSSRPINRRRFR